MQFSIAYNSKFQMQNVKNIFYALNVCNTHLTNLCDAVKYISIPTFEMQNFVQNTYFGNTFAKRRKFKKMQKLELSLQF